MEGGHKLRSQRGRVWPNPERGTKRLFFFAILKLFQSLRVRLPRRRSSDDRSSAQVNINPHICIFPHGGKNKRVNLEFFIFPFVLFTLPPSPVRQVGLEGFSKASKSAVRRFIPMPWVGQRLKFLFPASRENSCVRASRTQHHPPPSFQKRRARKFQNGKVQSGS